MSRNVRWAIGVGCLLPLCCTLFIGGLAGIIFTVIRNSDVATQAIEIIQDDPRVQDKLGEPVEIGWLITGNVEVNNSSGSANLTIPVSGPKGSGTVIVDATRSGGVWEFDAMMFSVDGEEAVDITRQ